MITPLPLGEGKGEGPLLALNAVCSVLLCKSVRNRTHPLDEITHKQLAAEFFLSQSAQSSLSIFGALFEPMRGRGQLRKGVAQLLLVREVTPTKRLIKGEKTLINVCKYYQK